MSFSGNDKVVYTCTALAGTNKTGSLTPDEDGYYLMVVGAFNAFNSSNDFYPLEPAKKIFDQSSSFMRRVLDGSCKGEMGHPKPEPGSTKRDFINRICYIEETKVCCHFKSFELVPSVVDGKSIVEVRALVKPSGPMGPALKESLENKDENVSFSIRSLTNDYINNQGVLIKNLKTLITFDCVTEPGINAAKKWNSPSLEALDEALVLKEYFDSIEEESNLICASMESTGPSIADIRKDLGWDVQRPVNNAPLSSGW